MRSSDPLFLHEEILLLVLRDQEGTIKNGTMYTFAIGGCAVAELLLHERIRITDDRRKRVEVINPSPVGDSFLDDCLARLVKAKRPATVATWVSRFSSGKRFRHRVAKRLCELGVLRAEERKVLGIFKRAILPENNPEPERALRRRLHEAVTTDRDDTDVRTTILVAIADSANVLRAVLGKKIVKARRQRIKDLAEGNVTSEAVKDAIQAMQMTLLATTVTLITTIMTSS